MDDARRRDTPDTARRGHRRPSRLAAGAAPRDTHDTAAGTQAAEHSGRGSGARDTATDLHAHAAGQNPGLPDEWGPECAKTYHLT